MSGIFTARYGGTCDDCGEPIRPGALVRFKHGDRLLVHGKCPEVRPICPRCHLTAPCDCEPS